MLLLLFTSLIHLTLRWLLRRLSCRLLRGLLTYIAGISHIITVNVLWLFSICCSTIILIIYLLLLLLLWILLTRLRLKRCARTTLIQNYLFNKFSWPSFSSIVSWISRFNWLIIFKGLIHTLLRSFWTTSLFVKIVLFLLLK